MELVLAWVAAYNAGDLAAHMEFFAPDVEAFPDTGFLEASPLHGRAEYRAWLEEITSAWTSSRWETKEVLTLGTDRVLHRGDWGGVGVGSGIETFANYTAILTIRDSQIREAEYFADHDKALKAAGLQE